MMRHIQIGRIALAFVVVDVSLLAACDSYDSAPAREASYSSAPSGAPAESGVSAREEPADSIAPTAALAASMRPSGPAPERFVTLAPHAALPSESDCSAWVSERPTPENISENVTANRTVPPADWLAVFYANPIYECGPDLWCKDLGGVTGNFTGSTEMIIRWGACKWGIDEDLVRAQAVVESSWRMSDLGDSDVVCHSRNVAPGALNYWSEPGPCKPSKGLLQLKLVYYNAAPYAMTSTAFNVDFTYGSIRACMNGDQSYLSTARKTSFGAYPPTTTDDALWGCIGRHFSGSWGDYGAVDYVKKVKDVMTKRGWPQ